MSAPLAPLGVRVATEEPAGARAAVNGDRLRLTVGALTVTPGAVTLGVVLVEVETAGRLGAFTVGVLTVGVFTGSGGALTVVVVTVGAFTGTVGVVTVGAFTGTVGVVTVGAFTGTVGVFSTGGGGSGAVSEEVPTGRELAAAVTGGCTATATKTAPRTLLCDTATRPVLAHTMQG